MSRRRTASLLVGGVVAAVACGAPTRPPPRAPEAVYKVLDARTRQPIAGARVTIYPLPQRHTIREDDLECPPADHGERRAYEHLAYTAETDAAGEARLPSDLPPGEQKPCPIECTAPEQYEYYLEVSEPSHLTYDGLLATTVALEPLAGATVTTAEQALAIARSRPTLAQLDRDARACAAAEGGWHVWYPGGHDADFAHARLDLIVDGAGQVRFVSCPERGSELALVRLEGTSIVLADRVTGLELTCEQCQIDPKVSPTCPAGVHPGDPLAASRVERLDALPPTAACRDRAFTLDLTAPSPSGPRSVGRASHCRMR